MVFCEHCGGTVVPGLKFCENCGAPVGNPPLPLPPQAPTYHEPTAPSSFPKPPAPEYSRGMRMKIIGIIVFWWIVACIIGAAAGGLPGLIIGFIIAAVLVAAYYLTR